jgi:hypothetical protein
MRKWKNHKVDHKTTRTQKQGIETWGERAIRKWKIFGKSSNPIISEQGGKIKVFLREG